MRGRGALGHSLICAQMLCRWRVGSLVASVVCSQSSIDKRCYLVGHEVFLEFGELDRGFAWWRIYVRVRVTCTYQLSPA